MRFLCINQISFVLKTFLQNTEKVHTLIFTREKVNKKIEKHKMLFKEFHSNRKPTARGYH